MPKTEIACEGGDRDRRALDRRPALHEVRDRPGPTWVARSQWRPEHAVLAGASQAAETRL